MPSKDSFSDGTLLLLLSMSPEVLSSFELLSPLTLELCEA